MTTPPSPAPDAFGSGLLTAADFHAALIRSLDASKPDPLSRRQIENLRLGWEQQGEEGELQRPDGTLRGTLTLSSDVVSVAIHVDCKYRCNGDRAIVHVDCKYRCNGNQTIANKVEDTTSTSHTRFEQELHIELTAGARFVPVADHNASIKGEKVDRKERAMKKKLRAGMIDRLRADSLVRRLLAEDDANKEDRMPLCEALIQQNGHGNTNELEERVNVNDNTLEGIRRAIFSHTEDNMDVLELLLFMPYLPRATTASGSDSNTALTVMAERAYLRLLEDAMFDACEREGEDELLDDLDISDAHHDHCSTSKDCDDDERKGKRKKTTAPRR